MSNITQIAKKVSLETRLNELLNDMSFEGLKEARKVINNTIRDHENYVAPTTKLHIKAKNNALELILNKVCGFNAALKEIKKLLGDGSLNIAMYTTKEVHQNHIDFCIKGIKNVKMFMSAKECDLTAFTPKIILNTIIKAATLKPEAFAKRVK